MKALRFTLRGKTAFFKKPDVNTYMYFTYGNIHKIAVLGIIGAALGLRGYNEQKGDTYPEFYEKLKELKIAIVPQNERGYIPKKVQKFNNSVGYASKEAGGNLIVSEQWLEYPKWDIYIVLDENLYGDEISDRFKNYNFVYIPYLGKNDHFATIENCCELELSSLKKADKVDSLFLKRYFEILKPDALSLLHGNEPMWKYEEKLPIALEKTTNQYVTESMVFTNAEVKPTEKFNLYSCNEKVLFIF